MRILLITRKYPPSIGGMQKFNYQLFTHLGKLAQVRLVSWGGSQKWLFFVYPYLMAWSFLKAKAFKPDIIHLGDAMMTPLGLILKKLTGKKITCTVYGLDIIFSFPGYQRLMIFCLSRLDKVICISAATQKECFKRGLSKEKVVIIPSGIEPKMTLGKREREEGKKKLGIKLNDKKVLLSVGRLVRRKGHEWFIKKVMPKLGRETLFLIVGDGPEREKIEREIRLKKLENQVFLSGWIEESFKNFLYRQADLFIMPNIKVKGDMEGLGVVILEAGINGLFTVASNLEGITDVVKSGVNGLLLSSSRAGEWSTTIKYLLSDPSHLPRKKRISNYCFKNYNWTKITKEYLRIFKCLDDK